MTPARTGAGVCKSPPVLKIWTVLEDGLDAIVGSYQSAIELVSALAERYKISAIHPLLETCRTAATRSDFVVAVLGRFKAGKSSFLNHFIGRDILPVSVIPVTSIVTEVVHGPVDVVEIRFGDGRDVRVPIADLRSYVSETDNPHNKKSVLGVSVQVPELSRWQGIRFVDTPGLESAFVHNSEVSLAWAPNVDIALVAIGVDTPLSRQDIELIDKLLTYTPRVAVLLTKVDVLSETEQREVINFVRTQLERTCGLEIPIYPYSMRAGYEKLRRELEQSFVARVASDVAVQRVAIVNQKIATLLRECEDYIRLMLKSAEMLDSERLALQQPALAGKDALKDTKLGIELLARNAAGGARQSIEKTLAPDEAVVRRELLEAFDRESSSFPGSFAGMLEFFDEWLRAALASRLAILSEEKRKEFAQPVADLQRQYQRLLQNFRDRLSERTMALYGIPLRTTEPDIRPQPPKAPDVKIGRAFDHNWELLSPLIPMSILRQAVLRRFRRKIADEAFKNLSRLTAQWDEIVRATA
jgi:GTP-binding protein EngB required for normal cell division